MIRLLTLIALTLIFPTLQAPGLAATDAKIKPEPSAHLKKLLKKYQIKSEDVSFHVVNLKEQTAVEILAPTRPEVPASLMKVPTCLYSLSKLGGHHRFSTQLLARGKIVDGELKGDLILKGHGDPYLTSARLFDLSLKLVQSGVKKVSGEFYYDDSALPKQEKISKMGHGDQSYNPGLGALNFEFNRIRVNKSPSSSRTFHARFNTIPILKHFSIEKVKTPLAPRQKFSWKDLGGHQEIWKVTTKQHYKEFEDIPIRRPSMYAAEMLRIYSKRLGLNLKSPQPFPLSDQLESVQILTETLSPPVQKICAMALEYSNNLFAESLILSTAKAQDPNIQSLEQAGKLMLEWFKKTYTNLEWKGAYFENGSGLSLNSRISAQTLTNLLVHEHKRKDLNRSFWSLLSISGQTGWLKNRLTEKEVSHRVFAKTGSLDFVHNISGYFLSHNNKSYAFTLMISDIEKRMRAEKLKNDSSAYSALYRQARNYRQRALKLADEIMTHWIQQL